MILQFCLWFLLGQKIFLSLEVIFTFFMSLQPENEGDPPPDSDQKCMCDTRDQQRTSLKLSFFVEVSIG